MSVWNKSRIAPPRCIHCLFVSTWMSRFMKVPVWIWRCCHIWLQCIHDSEAASINRFIRQSLNQVYTIDTCLDDVVVQRLLLLPCMQATYVKSMITSSRTKIQIITNMFINVGQRHPKICFILGTSFYETDGICSTPKTYLLMCTPFAIEATHEFPSCMLVNTLCVWCFVVPNHKWLALHSREHWKQTGSFHSDIPSYIGRQLNSLSNNMLLFCLADLSNIWKLVFICSCLPKTRPFHSSYKLLLMDPHTTIAIHKTRKNWKPSKLSSTCKLLSISLTYYKLSCHAADANIFLQTSTPLARAHYLFSVVLYKLVCARVDVHYIYMAKPPNTKLKTVFWKTQCSFAR